MKLWTQQDRLCPHVLAGIVLVKFLLLLTISYAFADNASDANLNYDMVTVGTIEATNRQATYLEEQSWTQTIHYPDATYIKVHLLDLNLLPGDHVTVSGLQGVEVYTYPGSGYTTDAEEGFWAMSVMGDTAVITLHSTRNNEEIENGLQADESAIVIDKYARGYPREDFDQIESVCGNDDRKDVLCYESSHPTEFENSRAVTGLLLNNGTNWCSGWRVGPDNHMFTNEHCISSQPALDAAEMWFDYQRLGCGSGENATPTKITGNTLLIDDFVLDFALFTVDDFEAIADFGFLELDPRIAIEDEEIYIPQQPGFMGIKKFGIESDQHAGNVCRVDVPIMNGRGVDTDTGYLADTAGGSSGSPVLARSSHKVIAIHHFGGCLNSGVRMDLIWPLVQPFLGGGLTFDITAVPNPATPGDPFEIRMDLENTGLGLDADFRLLAVVSGEITPLVHLSPFISSGLVLTGVEVFSTPKVPAGLPPVVGFVAAIFDTGDGELIGWDFEGVGIGASPSAAEIAALRQTAADLLNSSAVNRTKLTPAAPPRSELGGPTNRTQSLTHFNGTAKNPFPAGGAKNSTHEQRITVKGKLTTTWGGLKTGSSSP